MIIRNVFFSHAYNNWMAERRQNGRQQKLPFANLCNAPSLHWMRLINNNGALNGIRIKNLRCFMKRALAGFWLKVGGARACAIVDFPPRNIQNSFEHNFFIIHPPVYQFHETRSQAKNAHFNWPAKSRSDARVEISSMSQWCHTHHHRGCRRDPWSQIIIHFS